MRWFLGMVLLAAACGGKQARVIENDPPAPSAYAGWLRDGARWTFRMHEDVNTQGLVDPADVVYAADDPTASCWVDEAVAIAGGRAVSIACDETFTEISKVPLDRAWAETADGLFALEEMPDAGAVLTLPADQAFLSSPPVERETTTPLPHGEGIVEEEIITDRVESDGDAWCVVHDLAATRGEGWRLCLGADGPVEGSSYWESLEEIHSGFFRRADLPGS